MEETTFDFREAALFLRRKAGVLILGLLAGAALGFLINTVITPVYQSTTMIMITRAGQDQSSDFTTYLSDLQMTQTYVQLLTTETILDIASSRLGFEIDPDMVNVRAVQDTQVIVVTVEDNDPQQAARIANKIIEVLMEQNEFIQSGHYASMEESLNSQKAQIEREIQNLQTQIEQVTVRTMQEQKIWLEEQLSALQVEEAALQQEISKLGIANTVEKRLLLNQKSTRLNQIQSLIAIYQINYNDILAVYDKPAQDYVDVTNAQIRLLGTTQALYQQYYVTVLGELETIHLAHLQNVPNIVQIEPATVPEEPLRPIPKLNIILGGVAGLVFVFGIVFLLEALDDTLKTPNIVEHVFDAPVLGFISGMRNRKNHANRIYVVDQPDAPNSEAFRSLRVNLELASAQKAIHTLLVTSQQPREGKTTVAINLAATFVQTGKRAILLDADLRHPHIHTALGLPNETGFSDLFYEQIDAQTVCHTSADLPNLTIITSGNSLSNPSEILSSEKMCSILGNLQRMADIVVIDSPALKVADAQILAHKVDAVLFVLQPGVNHIKTAQNSMKMFRRAGAHVVGVVMNRVPRNRGY